MASNSTKGLRRLSVLSEPMRLDILAIISSSGNCCAKDILSNLEITQPTLSHHMSVLIENNLVNSQKDGRFVRYSINKSGVEELKSVLDSLILDASTSESLPSISSSIDKDEKKKKKTDKKKKDKKKKK